MSSPDPIFALHTGSSLRPADDLVSLKQHLPGGKFHYIDIATEQVRDLALARWPLMAELHSHHTHRGAPSSGTSGHD